MTPARSLSVEERSRPKRGGSSLFRDGYALIARPGALCRHTTKQRDSARWVLSAAPYIAVLSPPELRGMVHDLAAEMMEKNAPNPNPTEEDAPDAPSSPRPEKTNGAVSG